MDSFLHILRSYSLCFPFVALAGLAYWLLRGRFLRKRSRPRDPLTKEILRLLFVCYLAGLLSLVWTPPNFWNELWFWLTNGFPSGVINWTAYPSFNLAPSLYLYLRGELTGGSWVQFMAVGNVLMYVPLGVFLPWIWEKAKLPQILAVGFALSAVTELGQPFIGRSFDVDDLIANTLGVLLGLAAFYVFRWMGKKLFQKYGGSFPR